MHPGLARGLSCTCLAVTCCLVVDSLQLAPYKCILPRARQTQQINFHVQPEYARQLRNSSVRDKPLSTRRLYICLTLSSATCWREAVAWPLMVLVMVSLCSQALWSMFSSPFQSCSCIPDKSHPRTRVLSIFANNPGGCLAVAILTMSFVHQFVR